MERSSEKIPEYLLELHESLLLAQLRTIRKLRPAKAKTGKAEVPKGMSHIDMAIDILRRAQRPLHVSEIISRVKTVHGASLDRESLVSALVKKLNRIQGLTRTAPNTFLLTVK
ncbi:MAG TPA: hypothetical protein DCP92_08615 [Nitrospiraceae bacterium]|jgi:hypothetical protein|nr:hypothetical protein [Nitrospiraceae bacterium]